MCSKDFQHDKGVKKGRCSLTTRFFSTCFILFYLFYIIDFGKVTLFYKAICYGTLYHSIEASTKVVGNVEKKCRNTVLEGIEDYSILHVGLSKYHYSFSDLRAASS